MKKIVLLGGLCYAGKTYIADLLCGTNDKWQKMSFANALKDELHDAGLIDKKLLHDKEYKSSVRELMQQHGQNKRAADPFYWARIMEAHISDSPADVVIIDDWRFKNEAQYFIDKGYPVLKIYVKRDDYYKLKAVGKDTLTKYYLGPHLDVSEQELWGVSKEWIDGAPYHDLVYYNNNIGGDELLKKELVPVLTNWRAVKKYGQKTVC